MFLVILSIATATNILLAKNNCVCQLIPMRVFNHIQYAWYRCVHSIHTYYVCATDNTIGGWNTNTYAANKSPPLYVMGCDAIWNIQRKLKTFTVSIHFSPIPFFPFISSFLILHSFLRSRNVIDSCTNKYKYPYLSHSHTMFHPLILRAHFACVFVCVCHFTFRKFEMHI